MPRIKDSNIQALGKARGKAAVIETFNGEIVPNCDQVFVFGVDDDGLIIWNSNCKHHRDLIWALEMVKHQVLFDA